jgi:hypothetical protein
VVESLHDFRTSGCCGYSFSRTLHDGECGLHGVDPASRTTITGADLSLPILYVVSNASAYTYVDDMRPTSAALPKTVAAAAPGSKQLVLSSRPHHLSRMPTPKNALDLTTGRTG